jgi:NAD-dependent deacetylase
VWAKPAPRVRIPLSPPLVFKMKNIQYQIKEAQELIKSFDKIAVFSGAGISIASGVPTFRGPNGLWSRYNPVVLDIEFFKSNPKESWQVIKEIFFDFMQNIKPNAAHYAIAKLMCPVITQNIDNLHQEAGSKNVIEFHGSAKTLICTNCSKRYKSDDIDLSNLPPKCKSCGGILKPDFVFFKEPISEKAYKQSIILAQNISLMIIAGTTGEIMPASQIPYIAKENGAKIIEINIEPSAYTNTITDIFLNFKAEDILPKLI